MSEIHQMALQSGFLVRQNMSWQFEVLCAATGEIISRNHATREKAWEWAYEQVRSGRTALRSANEQRKP